MSHFWPTVSFMSTLNDRTLILLIFYAVLKCFVAVFWKTRAKIVFYCILFFDQYYLTSTEFHPCSIYKYETNLLYTYSYNFLSIIGIFPFKWRWEVLIIPLWARLWVIWAKILSPLFESVSSPGLMTQEAYIVVYFWGQKRIESRRAPFPQRLCVWQFNYHGSEWYHAPSVAEEAGNWILTGSTVPLSSPCIVLDFVVVFFDAGSCKVDRTQWNV